MIVLAFFIILLIAISMIGISIGFYISLFSEWRDTKREAKLEHNRCGSQLFTITCREFKKILNNSEKSIIDGYHPYLQLSYGGQMFKITIPRYLTTTVDCISIGNIGEDIMIMIYKTPLTAAICNHMVKKVANKMLMPRCDIKPWKMKQN